MSEQFEPGKIYPMTLAEGQSILRQMGMMAIFAEGIPDTSRGRRCVSVKSANEVEWEFWMSSGQKVSFSICNGVSPHRDHFIASVSREPDSKRPDAQFPQETPPAPKAMKCIKPDCLNMVAPVGTKKPEAGVYKNYRATGACQQGHNIYFCAECNAPHSYVSRIGKHHYGQNHGFTVAEEEPQCGVTPAPALLS